MDSNKKVVVRERFKIRVYESEGQSFEDLFTCIMQYAEPDFQQIKPWGNIGDRKNDGYILSKGIYFQVYAPEDISKSINKAVKKLESDFSGLLEEWKGVKEYHFVINNKYKGVPPQLAQAIQKIAEDYSIKADIWTVNKLEDLVLSLDDDKISIIVGRLPNPADISTPSYDILGEVIEHLMKLDISTQGSVIGYPNWGDKIKFNGLSKTVERWLDAGFLHVVALDKYLDSESNFHAEEVKNKIRKIYIDKARDFSGDELFIEIRNTVSPRAEIYCRIAAIIIMAKYFEICEIFEEPK